MKFNIQKYYYKLFDNKKYRRLKQQNVIQESVEIFENKYRAYLYGIDRKIKNNKKITFLAKTFFSTTFFRFTILAKSKFW